MAQRKNLTIVIGLLIVVAAMLVGALLSVMIPSQAAGPTGTTSAAAQMATSNAGTVFGPLLVFAREPQAIRP